MCKKQLMNTKHLLCIPRMENIITKDYILRTFNKLKIGSIEQISEIPLRNDTRYKRIIIKVNWSDSDNANFIQNRLDNNETVKVVYEFPWFWKVVSKGNHGSPALTQTKTKNSAVKRDEYPLFLFAAAV